MNILKGSVIFVVGAALGVGGSYKYFEKKFGDIADAEIESYKMVAGNRERINKKVNEVCDGDKVTDEDLEDDERPQFTEEELEEANRSYNEISAAYKSKVADSVNKEPQKRVNYSDMSNKEPEQTNKVVDISGLRPIIISDKSFVEDCQNYDKITLTYYAIDGVLLDDNNDVFEDFEDYVGHDTMSKFGAFDVGDNLVYVRNDLHENDYEIIKLDESYA